MASARYYSSTAVATTLSGAINNTTPTINVVSVTGYPTQFPYTAILERGTVSEEAVSVTAAAGTTLTVTRGVDGTSAVAHSSGAAVEHGVTARDFQEPQDHIAKTNNAHGITGSFVGDSDVQTLTNKTLDGATLNDPTLIQPVIADFTLAPHDHADADDGGQLSFAALAQAGTSYTPTWTASTTDPTIGNGTKTGRYFQLGKLVFYAIKIVVGSTTDKGIGSYFFGIPVAAAVGMDFEGNASFGAASGTPDIRNGRAIVNGTTGTLQVSYDSATAGDNDTFGTAVAPGLTLATGDIVRITGWYEAA